MRSALTQAIEILGEDADRENLAFLACVISDMMTDRIHAAIYSTPEWRSLTSGAERVRFIVHNAVEFHLCDFTEPRHVLVRLGFVPP